MTTTQSEFDQIYHDYYPRIAAYVYHILGNHEDAEDLAQETFLKVARALPGLVPDHISSWIYRIATNTVRDALRQRAATQPSVSHLDFETATMHLATDENPEMLYVASEQFQQAWRLLPRRYQMILTCLATDAPLRSRSRQRISKDTLARARRAFREAYRQLDQQEAPGRRKGGRNDVA